MNLETKIAKLDEYLKKTISDRSVYHEAMRYSLFAGGKRLRPLIVYSVMEDFNVMENVDPAAACVEIFHTATLIHDDLPSIDDADMRRGKKSLHKVFGDAMATVAADGMLTESIRVLTKMKSLELIETFMNAACDVVMGEAYDIYYESKDVDYDLLMKINELKTGALFGYCFSSAAALRKMDTHEYERTGRDFGLAFQIYDDIKDISSTEETLGKPVGRDYENGKKTIPMILGIEKASKIADDMYSKVIGTLKNREMHHTVELMEKIYYKVRTS
jgi:geranylgeranyl diphosphate synthase type II